MKTKRWSRRTEIALTVVVVALATALAFIWFPLFPIVIPVIALGVVAFYVIRNVLNEVYFKEHDIDGELKPELRQGLLRKAWPNLAGLPSPAGAGPLPHSSARQKKRDRKTSKE